LGACLRQRSDNWFQNILLWALEKNSRRKGVRKSIRSSGARDHVSILAKGVGASERSASYDRKRDGQKNLACGSGPWGAGLEMLSRAREDT